MGTVSYRRRVLRRRKEPRQERSAAGIPVFRYEAQERGWTPAAPSPDGWHEAVDDHREQHLGPSASVIHEIASDLVHIDLHLHEPSVLRPFWTIATGGVSDLATAAPEEMAEYRRIELLTYLPAAWTDRSWGPGPGASDVAWWPLGMLKEVGRFVHEYRTWVGPGHTIALGGEDHDPLTPGSLLTSVLLLQPVLEADSFDELRVDGTRCRFLWVCPITEAEEQLTLEQGTSALDDLMDRHQLAREIDPGRACMVTGRRP
jgi:hypothetical protein